MNFIASGPAYKNRNRIHKFRRQVWQQDLVMFEALTGKSASVAQQASSAVAAMPSDVAPTPAVAKRWKPNVEKLTVRLRSMCEHAVGAKPAAKDWFGDLPQSIAVAEQGPQPRIQTARYPSPQSDVDDRVVLTIRPEEVIVAGDSAVEAAPYKRVA